ncbi:hypothetical protein [Weissella bombi]|uniref:hypothetical protein n=1 Tax=Weissella bombi TaxID=1505725 RepID=UPI003AF25058
MANKESVDGIAIDKDMSIINSVDVHGDHIQKLELANTAIDAHLKNIEDEQTAQFLFMKSLERKHRQLIEEQMEQYDHIDEQFNEYEQELYRISGDLTFSMIALLIVSTLVFITLVFLIFVINRIGL